MRRVFLLITGLFFNVSVFALTSNEIAAELNKLTPMEADEITTLKNVDVDEFDSIVYSYYLKADHSLKETIAKSIEINRDAFRVGACSSLLTRNVLKMDKVVKYKYHLDNGEYLKTIIIGEYHCSKLGIPSPL